MCKKRRKFEREHNECLLLEIFLTYIKKIKTIDHIKRVKLMNKLYAAAC